MTVIHDIFKVSVEQQARNNSLLKKALRARSKRACIFIAVFLVVLVVVNCVIAWILVRKATLIGNFEDRLHELEEEHAKYKFNQSFHDINQTLATLQDNQMELKSL